jgi:hypothetical protein
MMNGAGLWPPAGGRDRSRGGGDHDAHGAASRAVVGLERQAGIREAPRSRRDAQADPPDSGRARRQAQVEGSPPPQDLDREQPLDRHQPSARLERLELEPGAGQTGRPVPFGTRGRLAAVEVWLELDHRHQRHPAEASDRDIARLRPRAVSIDRRTEELDASIRTRRARHPAVGQGDLDRALHVRRAERRHPAGAGWLAPRRTIDVESSAAALRVLNDRAENAFPRPRQHPAVRDPADGDPPRAPAQRHASSPRPPAETR